MQYLHEHWERPLLSYQIWLIISRRNNIAQKSPWNGHVLKKKKYLISKYNFWSQTLLRKPAKHESNLTWGRQVYDITTQQQENIGLSAASHF